MRSRGSHKVASTELGKVAKLDQSYRSCLMALIIFFFLCIILILASLFVQKSGKSYQSIIAMPQTASNSPTEKRKPLLIPNADIEPPRGLDDDSDETSESPPFLSDHASSTEKYTITTDQPDDTTKSSTEHSHVNAVQQIPLRGATPSDTDNSTTLTPGPPNYTVDIQSVYTQNTTRQGNGKSNNSTLADNMKTSESDSIRLQSNSTESIKTMPTEMASHTTAIFSTDNSMEPTPNTLYLTEDLQTSSTGRITEQGILQNDFSTVANNAETSEFVSNHSQLTSTETVTSPNNATTITDIDQTKLVQLVKEVYHGTNIYEDTSITDIVIAEVEQNIPPSPPDNSTCTSNTCEDSGCKHIASKILSYMDHWGNACVDFYEYACGGLEADYQISEKDLSRRAYETIKYLAEQKSTHSRSAQFNRYYYSCLNYEGTYNIFERVKFAKKALEKIGKFCTTTQWEEGHETKDLTEMFTNILQNDWPLLFDIVPDVDIANPEIFTLTIGPRQLVFDNKPFQFQYDPHRCDNKDGTISDGHIDFDALYGMYEICKKNTKGFMDSINQTLSTLHIFDSLENGDDRSQNIELTMKAIDIDIIEGILKKYPSEREIHEVYRSKNYTVMTLGDLQGNRKSINWTQLIRSLTKLDLGKDTRIYVYNKKELIDAMNELEQLWKNRPHDLNNALLGLYSQYLYNTFVTAKSRENLHNHCLYNAVHSMKDVASELYMQSFTDIEIDRMNKVMKNHFEALKETLRENIKKIKWATDAERKRLLEKLNDMKMSLPERSEEEEEEEAIKLDINDNYFENSMKSMKKYRTMMYSMTKKKPLKEIWKFLASPFETTGQTIYALNLIAMPYGAIEVDMKTSTMTEGSISYLTLATIGNVIARQIAQNFDMTAMRYWNGFTRDKTKDTYENEYIRCHQSLYEDSTVMNWTVTGKSLNVHFKAHCTKAPLGSSYISLNEDPFLPSRIRVYVASNNNGLFDKEWDCPLSTLAPPSDCRAFPYLDDDQ